MIDIIISIIGKGQQYKTEREGSIPYQSEDPCLIIPTNRKKTEKG